MCHGCFSLIQSTADTGTAGVSPAEARSAHGTPHTLLFLMITALNQLQSRVQCARFALKRARRPRSQEEGQLFMSSTSSSIRTDSSTVLMAMIGWSLLAQDRR